MSFLTMMVATMLLTGTTGLNPSPVDESDLKPVEGAWVGSLEPQPGIKLKLVLRVEKKDKNKAEYQALLDSPDQGANGLKIDSISLTDKTLKFEMKEIFARYEGTLDEANEKIKGKWTQGGGSLSLDLQRAKAEELAGPKRPQHPKPPYGYGVEDVKFAKSEKSHKLAGTLTLPKGDGPFPAAVLISGSGAQDRDETLLGHKPFLVLADALTKRGIAVLRYDDRGVGKSEGRYDGATSLDFAQDAEAAVDYLKTRKEIDAKKIGLIGHSEGGLIAPMVAAQRADLGFIVLLAGPGVSGARILEIQGQLIAKAQGASDKDVETSTKVQKRLIAVVKSEPDVKKAAEALKQEIEAMEKELAGEDLAAFQKLKPLVNAQVSTLNDPWFRYFLVYEPASSLTKVKCPVLAINGELDLQVEPKENLAKVAQALKEGGNSRFTIKELPKLNHLFQTAKTGSVGEYAQIEETFAPSALKLVADWVLENTQ